MFDGERLDKARGRVGPDGVEKSRCRMASAGPGAVASTLTQAKAQGWATATWLEPTAGDRPTGLAAPSLSRPPRPGFTITGLSPLGPATGSGAG